MSSTPVTPESAADHPVYAVAGGNHVAVELDRAVTGGSLDVIEVLARARRRAGFESRDVSRVPVAGKGKG